MEFKYDVPSFLERDGNSLVYNDTGEMYIYVPELYFKNEYAMEFGDKISLMGIADFSIRNNPDKPVYGKDLHNLYFPSIFVTQPYATEKIKSLTIGNNEDMEYRILKYKKGDKVVCSVMVPQVVTNAEEFYRLMVITAKIPSTVKYGTIWKYFLKNIELVGANYNINAAAFGMIESELCRDPNDPSKPFRLSKKFDNKNAYNIVSIKELPRYISPYAAITSENWDESMIAACMNDEEVYSPLEKILMP